MVAERGWGLLTYDRVPVKQLVLTQIILHSLTRNSGEVPEIHSRCDCLLGAGPCWKRITQVHSNEMLARLAKDQTT